MHVQIAASRAWQKAQRVLQSCAESLPVGHRRPRVGHFSMNLAYWYFDRLTISTSVRPAFPFRSTSKTAKSVMMRETQRDPVRGKEHWDLIFEEPCYERRVSIAAGDPPAQSNSPCRHARSGPPPASLMGSPAVPLHRPCP